VTKFSYLKELVDVKVRKLIDGLPFTGEGYARDILKKQYGQTSEVVSAYVRAILELPTIKEILELPTINFQNSLLLRDPVVNNNNNLIIFQQVNLFHYMN
jgi:hypothetical protein